MTRETDAQKTESTSLSGAVKTRATSLSGAKRTRSTSAAAARKTGSTSEIGRYTVCLYVKGMQTCSLPCF